MPSLADLKGKVIETAKAYQTACSVGCKVVDPSGQVVASFQDPQEIDFCGLLKGEEQNIDTCRNSNRYGGLQAEKLGHYYIYFCPFGLGNWAVPVYEGKELKFYLIGGPVLLHPLDDLLVEDVWSQISQLTRSKGELKTILQGIQVVGPTRVRYLAQVLLSMAQTLMPDQRHILEERYRFSVLSDEIATERIAQQVSLFELEGNLLSQMKTGDQQGAREALNQILGYIYFDDVSFEIKKNRLIALMAVLARTAIEAGADLELIFGLEYQYLSKMEKTGDLLELSSLLGRVLERFIECSFSLRDVKNRDLMFKAMNFIRSHYGESISLEDVAREVDLHPTYFSKLFKEEMNLSYTDYLNRVRIEAAKVLLRQEHALVDVAQTVGFNDQSYFSKIFRKMEGVSPGRWRSRR